jgi:hypothetical protein
MENVISEVINNYLKKNVMLKEYKNPQDAETLRVCADMLQNLYDNAISNGTSRHEITVQKIHQIIGELRKLQQIMTI